MGSLPIEGLEAAMRPERLYPVRTYEGYGFYAGLAADGCQVLAAVDGQTLLIVLFDAAGGLRESLWWGLAPGENVKERSGATRMGAGAGAGQAIPSPARPRTAAGPYATRLGR